MNRLNKALAAVVTIAALATWLSVATPAQAAPSGHHHHHAHHHHHHGHHHHGVRYWRGGRWVYLSTTGPVYNVYYRGAAASPWVLYGPYGTADDAAMEVAYLRDQGYEAFVR